jgi:hypothetical protein
MRQSIPGGNNYEESIAVSETVQFFVIQKRKSRLGKHGDSFGYILHIKDHDRPIFVLNDKPIGVFNVNLLPGEHCGNLVKAPGLSPHFRRE